MKAKHLFQLAGITLAALWGPAIYFANCSACAQATAPSVRKGPVYVRDFLFDAQNLKPDEGLLGRRSGPVGRLIENLKPAEDPAVKARQFVELLSNTIVAGLNNAGISAAGLGPVPLPRRSDCWSAVNSWKWTKATGCGGPWSVSVRVVKKLKYKLRCIASRRIPLRLFWSTAPARKAAGSGRRRFQEPIRCCGPLRAFAQGDREGRCEARQSNRRRSRENIRTTQVRADTVGCPSLPRLQTG